MKFKLRNCIKFKYKNHYLLIIFLLFLTELLYFYFSGSFFFGKNSDAFEFKKLGFENKRGSVEKWQKELRKKLIELSGVNLQDSSFNILWNGERENKGGYTEEQLTFLFNKDKEVLCHLLIPEDYLKRKNPAVIFFPGHGEGIYELLEEPEGEGSYYQGSAAKFLAENGFITLTCEPWAFWSSSDNPGQLSTAINEASLKGRSIMGIYIDQVMAEVSFLHSLETVDTEKIGLAGVSFGGAVSFYTSAIDERISASFVSGFLTTFETTYFHYFHSVEMIIPGIYKWADIPDIAGLIAPRQVMFDNGETNNSLAMTGETAEILIEQKIRPIFKEFNAEDKIKLNKTKLGHALDREAALSFFKQAFND